MLGGPEVTIVIVLLLVLFGGSQLPKIARNLGRAQQELKAGLEEAKAESEQSEKSDTASTS